MVTYGTRNANAGVRRMTYSVADLYGRSLSQIYWGDRINFNNQLVLCFCNECDVYVKNNRVRMNIPLSSNGRTPGSGPGNRGSSPCEGAYRI